MNMMKISNLLNQKNNILGKEVLPKIKNTPSFSTVFNNEKSNFTHSKQSKPEEMTFNKHLDKSNKTSTVSNSQLDTYNNQTEKVSTKETKEAKNVNSDVDMESQDSLKNTDNELLNHIMLLLQNLATNFHIEISNVENDTMVNTELINIEIENLVNLADKLNLLLSEASIELDQAVKESIEPVLSMITDLVDKISLANKDEVLLTEEDIEKIFGSLQDLEGSIGVVLSNINSTKNSSTLNIQVKNQSNLIDTQEGNLLKDDTVLAHNMDDNDTEIVNKEGNIKGKELDQPILENHMENMDKVDHQELHKDLALNNSFSISQQEKMDQTIKVNVAENQILEPKQFISEIGQKASAFLSKDRNEMNIQLTPENLGKISIKIGLNDGTLTGKIYAENYSVKQIIEANLNQLRDALEENGLNIAGLEVNIGNNSQEFGSRMFQQNSIIRQKSKDDSTIVNSGYIGLEQDTNEVNPYLISGQFDGLV